MLPPKYIQSSGIPEKVMPAALLTGVEKAVTKNELVMARQVNLLIKFASTPKSASKKKKTFSCYIDSNGQRPLGYKNNSISTKRATEKENDVHVKQHGNKGAPFVALSTDRSTQFSE